MKQHEMALSVICSVVVAGLLRFWRLGDMPLSGDEAYYWLWSSHLAPAYYDHPAGVAVLLKLSAAFFGVSEFGLRMGNALLSILAVPMAYAVGRRYVSSSAGLLAAGALAVGPAYIVTGRIVYPDTLLIVFLLGSLLVFRPLLTGNSSWHQSVALGLTWTGAMNTKLTAGFYFLGVGIYILICRRDLLRAKHFWLAVGVSALGLIPLVSWNITHDWSQIKWALLQGQGWGLPAPHFLSVWGHAIKYHSPPAVLLAGAGVIGAALLARQGRSRTPAAVLPFAALAMLLPVLFSAANNPRNLSAGLAMWWPLAAIPLQKTFDGSQVVGGRITQIWKVGLSCASLFMAIYGYGTMQGLLGPTMWPASDAAPIVRFDMLGWRELAPEIMTFREELLFTVDYSGAAQLSYYADRPVYTASPQYRLWGIPPVDSMAVISLTYISPAEIDARLRRIFASVQGPLYRNFTDGELTKTVCLWRSEGRKVSNEEIWDQLDYLRLVAAAGGVHSPLREATRGSNVPSFHDNESHGLAWTVSRIISAARATWSRVIPR